MTIETVQTSVQESSPRAAQGGAAAGTDRREPSFLAILTLVIWLTCLAVGLLGMWLARPQPRPKPPPPEPPPVQAQLIDVDITREPILADALEPRPNEDPLPDAPPPAPSDVPPLPEVAAPSPAIAFALPVEGPMRIVPAPRATPARVIAPEKPPEAPAVRRITYGQGEGRQPAPNYPPQAVAEHEEGAVGIRFSVGEDGRVLAASVATPSRWPLLNQAALTAVRERWRFQSGPLRTYEVVIRFKLNQT